MGNVWRPYDLREPTPGHTDLARLKKDVGAQFWSVYIPGRDRGFWLRAGSTGADRHRAPDNREVSGAAGLGARRPTTSGGFEPGRSARCSGWRAATRSRTPSGPLRAFYDMGARYMTLTHNVTLDWADAAARQREHNGLTPFGERWCAR